MMKCFGYVRVSTSKQGEGVSLDEQREAIERYASQNEIEIVQWFEEEKTAAKRGRPEFNRMLELLRDGEADGVVIHKIDRSSRNLKDWAELGDLIDEGIEVHFAHEGFDLDSRAGRLSADIQAVVAADYIRNLRAETKKGFYGRLKQGIYPLPAPVGYEDIGPGEPKEIDPVEGPLVRQAFELYATGDYGLRDLAEEMTERGLTNRDGGSVTRTGLSTMLNNPFYYGLIRIKKTGETFEGAHEPLISKTLFDRVQRILNAKAPGKENRHRFVFRKLFECAHCGYSMIGEKQKGHIYYRCHTSDCPTKCVREETLDEAIRGKLRPLEFTKTERRRLQKIAENYRDEWEDQREDALESNDLQLEKLKSRLDRLTDAYLDQVIDEQEYQRRKESLLEKKQDLKAQRKRLTQRKYNLADQVQRFLERAGSACSSYEEGIPEEQRDLVSTVTSNRRVDGKEPMIKLKEPFRLVAERPSVTNGTPRRDKTRTLTLLVVGLGIMCRQRTHELEAPVNLSELV